VVSQSFLSVSLYLIVGKTATNRKCCHLPGKMFTFTAKAGDRAPIYLNFSLLIDKVKYKTTGRKVLDKKCEVFHRVTQDFAAQPVKQMPQ
jgi:hypothetical protein